MQGKLLVRAAENTDKVILGGPDRAFGRVRMMVTGCWYELVVDFFLLREFLADFGALIVKPLKDGSKTGLEEPLVDYLVCCKDSAARFAPHGLCPNGIGVVVVEYEDLLIVARTGRRNAPFDL